MESTAAARASEAGRAARRSALAGAVRAARLGIAGARAALDAARAAARDAAADLRAVEADIARANAETAQLRRELDAQTMSREERGRLLDEVHYATRVHDSKRVLAEQVAKMVLSKETELALWQRKTLDACVEYKQGLIHLSAQFPELAAGAVDETKLMEAESSGAAAAALEALKQLAARLAQRRAQLARTRSAHATERHARLEQARADIAEHKSKIEQTLRARDGDEAGEAGEEQAAAAAELRALARVQAARGAQQDAARAQEDLAFWKRQDEAWRAKLAEMRDYIRSQKEMEPALLRAAFEARVKIVAEQLNQWKINTDNVL